MTYVKPELLLVGAAQNLVLLGCNPPEDSNLSCGRDNFIGPLVYDQVDLW